MLSKQLQPDFDILVGLILGLRDQLDEGRVRGAVVRVDIETGHADELDDRIESTGTELDVFVCFTGIAGGIWILFGMPQWHGRARCRRKEAALPCRRRVRAAASGAWGRCPGRRRRAAAAVAEAGSPCLANPRTATHRIQPESETLEYT